MSEKADRIVRLAKSGRFTQQTCVADEVGVSREYVRQVLNAAGGFEGFGDRAGLRFEWDCPGCGELISLRRAELKALIRMPAHCRKCAALYCGRELHLMSETRISKTHGCSTCWNTHMREIVETRPCERCGKPYNISRGVAARKTQGYIKASMHKDCWYETMREYPLQP